MAFSCCGCVARRWHAEDVLKTKELDGRTRSGNPADIAVIKMADDDDTLKDNFEEFRYGKDHGNIKPTDLADNTQNIVVILGFMERLMIALYSMSVHSERLKG